MKSDMKADLSASTSSGSKAHAQAQRVGGLSEQEPISLASDEQPDQPTPILYKDFVIGQEMGDCTLTYDETFVQGWQQIFGQTALTQTQAASVSLILMMRAFLSIVSPRPPGNIHARQTLSFSSLPVLGDQLTVSAACLSKTMRKERRYVELGVKALNQQGIPVFAGVLTLIWAA